MEKEKILIMYYCKDCNTEKERYLFAFERGNTDYRQFCWKCKAITPHTVPILKATV